MKPGDLRITAETLAYGQPRPYASSYYTYRVTFEIVPYRVGADSFEPCMWNEQLIEQYLKAIKFFYHKDKMPDPFAPELLYIKSISPGVWEFSVREQYDD